MLVFSVLFSSEYYSSSISNGIPMAYMIIQFRRVCKTVVAWSRGRVVARTVPRRPRFTFHLYTYMHGKLIYRSSRLANKVVSLN